MATEVTVEELEALYFDFMRRVCLGESFTIIFEGQASAVLRPAFGAGRDEEGVKVLEELSSPRFAGASDEAICEWLGEPLPRPKEQIDGGDSASSSVPKEGEAEI